MNIQIFGSTKSQDTRKAERYFKERRIAYQMIDMKKKGMSGGEFDNVLRAVGGIDNLIDWDLNDDNIVLLKYMSSTADKEDKVFDYQNLIKLPVVRNGKQATAGYCPEIWAEWK